MLRKLHLAVDVTTHTVIDVEVNLETVADNEVLTALKAGELKHWKRNPGYHQRSIAETAIYRAKQLIGPKLSLWDYNA